MKATSAAKKKPAKKKPASKKPVARKRKPAKKARTTSRPNTAILGNQFWKMRSSHGRKPLFENGEKLWDACVEYFEWVEANPLKEEKIFTYEGRIVRGEVRRMRAMTLDGLYTFLDISPQAWHNFRSREGLSETVDQVERVIRDYKFAGAAADLLNAQIIARDLGLRDGMEHTGANGGPISGVLAIPTSPEDWAKIATAQQNALKQDDGK
jgi:hypothetical protein